MMDLRCSVHAINLSSYYTLDNTTNTIGNNIKQ